MAERTGYEAVMSKMEKEGITLSTVALGQGADTQLLDLLAKEATADITM